MGATRWLMTGVVALLFATGAAAQEMRIQFAEKVAINAAPGHTEFDAYGRRFSLDLQANDRLLLSLTRTGKVAIDSGRVLRGDVRGAAGSWVRLARVGDALEGAIWDGRDLYVVTSKGRIDPVSRCRWRARRHKPWSIDCRIPSAACRRNSADWMSISRRPRRRPGSRLEQYKSMVSELRANATPAPWPPTSSSTSR